MSDDSADPRLIRFSIGDEDVEDLKADLRNAFHNALQGKASEHGQTSAKL